MQACNNEFYCVESKTFEYLLIHLGFLHQSNVFTINEQVC